MVLVDSLIQQGWLKTPRIIDAFRAIRRVDFMPDDIKNLADLNEALPIGYGQTISQPLTVAFMLELLQPEPGHKILDVGSGSGWTTALLAYIISKGELNEKPKGKIIAMEIIPELKEFGEKNVSKYNFIKRGTAKFLCKDGSGGYPEEAPYDRILASASAEDIPRAWQEQLKVGGRIVAPIKSSVWLLVKKGDGNFDKSEYPGFAFVPLVGNVV